MKDYILYPAKDAHGQPLRLFRNNLINNAAKSIDQLSGICTGILADGVVTDQEAKFFADWVKQHSEFEPVWPLTDIIARVDRIFADWRIDEEERQELEQVMRAICGATDHEASIEARSCTLPLNQPQPKPLVFDNRIFSITGKFAFGTRSAVIEAIESRNGKASDSAPTRDTNYLLIGTFGSRDWIATNYGRKIERAVKLRESGTGLAIISEEHWRHAVR